MLTTFLMMACQSDEANAMPPADNNSDNGGNKTLIVYYSYTNNTEQIVDDLKTTINADVIEVEPVNKNLNYAANNYAIGTEQPRTHGFSTLQVMCMLVIQNQTNGLNQ